MRLKKNLFFHSELEISYVLLETLHGQFYRTTPSNSPEGLTPKLQSTRYVIQCSKPEEPFTTLRIPVENADH